MFFSKLLGLIFLFYTFVVCSSKTENTDVIEFCNELRSNRKLVLVSTLDGQLTALTLEKGEKQWSIATEPGPLLSSTIHHLELSENSQLVRIIPSLSGGLYKFDGESIEPMPVNADTLLRSYWDDVDISGGKEIRSYAIDIESGHVFYECSMNECSNWTENSYLHTDMIILKRETQKVRAIELQSRAERWNYSVGLHNVTVSHNAIPECNMNSNKSTEFYVRAIVPKGLLFVSRQENPEETLWEHEFDSPIVNVWTLVGSHLEWVDLFKPLENSSRKDKSLQPALYIGIHDDQLYIQESEPLYKNQLLLGKAHFSMKKYRLIHALDFENKQDVVPLIADESERNSTTALAMLYGSELVKGEGYYLYCTEGNRDCHTKKAGRFSTFFSSIYSTSSLYWKEMFILLSVTCYVIHCLIPMPNWLVVGTIDFVKQKFTRLWRSQETTESLGAVSSGRDSGISGVVCQTEIEIKDYKSRYLEDFEPIHCLGRGGFGVVFQARNKIDDCHYAIKRITLPNKEEARERVMREVKALAKLEHHHIVRYFQAWQECPPLGWQEEQDKHWKNKTKDEYLSSEAECLSEISITSSPSHYHRSNLNLNSNNAITKSNKDFSDSFIVFENSHPSCSTISNKYDSTTPIEKSTFSNRRKTANNKKSVNKTSKVYLYIQMQLCQKNSLREWLRDNLERDQFVVLQMFNQIIQAVEYVHLQGLIHRDLKPSNIFFSPDGQIKVGDFGLVTEIIKDNDLVSEQKKQSVSNGSHTANVGTELYMSPEQVFGKQYTYKVDIYSLGIILFELLTPFSTQMERYRALTNLRSSEFPQDFHLRHQPEYELLKLMLSEEPEKRPTTFGIRSRPPFNSFHASEQSLPSDWYFELPAKSGNSTNILRKSSNESV